MKYFVGTTNKNPLEYRCNEKIVFSAKAYTQDENGDKLFPCPKIRYVLCKDGYGICDEQCIDGKDAYIELETELDKPGFCYVTLYVCDEDGAPLPDCESIMLAAGVEIENITQAGTEPDDFDKFWAGALSELDKVAPEVIENNEVACNDSNFFARDVKVKCAGSKPSSFTLSIPKDTLEGKKYPIQMVFHGYGCGTALPACVKDVISVEVNPHGYLNFQDNKYYEDLANGELSGFGFNNNDSPDTCYFKYMILRDIQALKFALTLPQWDGKNVICSGGSMGGFQSTAVAALCSDVVTRVSAGVTWMCDVQGLVAEKRIRGWIPEPEKGLLYYDSVSFAKRVKCPVDLSVSMGDTVCRVSGLLAYYNAFNTPKLATFYQGNDHCYAMRVPETHTIKSN